jgi:uncharacterized protein YegJ (DUF2314 family)
MRFFNWSKKKHQPISWFEGQDVEMLEAIQQAQSTFPDFVSAIELESRRILPAMDDTLVKYAFPATKQRVKVEHMFLSNIEMRGASMYGILNSEPLYTEGINEGDAIEIDLSRISDWLYVVGGIGTGGYTFKVMWSRFSEKEKSYYRDQPPFVWLDLH